jgi:hypothetical protein
MTTDRHSVTRVTAAALTGWLVVLVGVTAATEPTRDVLLLGAPAYTLSLLAGSDTRLVTVGEKFTIVRGTEPGFVRALYANGAWLVLPARGKSCIDLSGFAT